MMPICSRNSSSIRNEQNEINIEFVCACISDTPGNMVLSNG
jgi:hypothetical protein